jgi:hypothetical protein
MDLSLLGHGRRARRARRILGAAVAVAALASSLAAPAAAAPPANDDIGSPTVVGALPWTENQDTTEATTGATDPDFCFGGTADGATVWFEFTAGQSRRYAASTAGSDYDTTLYVGTPSGGGLDVIDCTDDSPGLDLQSRVAWQADAGTTYLIMVGTCCGGGGGGGGALVFTVDEAPPAPTVDLTIGANGSVTRSGVATVRGTATCTGAPSLSLEIEVKEQVGRKIFTGFGEASLDSCSSQGTDWEVSVTAEDGKFGSGKVTVNAFAVGCNVAECAEDSESRQVSLKR